MPEIDKLDKLYYTISEVSKMFDVNDSTLRYWESEFSVLKPKKNRKGDRRYTKNDIIIIQKIYNLLKVKGFTLKGAKEELKIQIKSENKIEKVKTGLKKIKKGLEKLQNELTTS
ncbi:MAG TPA: MerR family transcriptional regulator [Saprospiraceae bacterium]|nr:MerR family transcriptional regulator [Saprospiraceae bacterium]HHH52330.1 MerR family transcriptional regulator [Bacteroidota bacterium]